MSTSSSSEGSNEKTQDLRALMINKSISNGRESRSRSRSIRRKDGNMLHEEGEMMRYQLRSNSNIMRNHHLSDRKKSRCNNLSLSQLSINNMMYRKNKSPKCHTELPSLRDIDSSLVQTIGPKQRKVQNNTNQYLNQRNSVNSNMKLISSERCSLKSLEGPEK